MIVLQLLNGRNKALLLFFVLCIFAKMPFSLAQSPRLPHDHFRKHLIDRYRILNQDFDSVYFPSAQHYNRADIVDLIKQIPVASRRDQFNRDYLINDNYAYMHVDSGQSKRPILKYFYQKKADFFSYQNKGTHVHLNPVLNAGLGSESAQENRIFNNFRGGEISGQIDGKVGFYTYLAESQSRLSAYERRYIQDTVYVNNPGLEDNLGRNVIPGEGFWKRTDNHVVDYFTARGYINFRATNHIQIEFGHDTHKIGSGIRSLILSDFPNAYTYLKLRTRFWKIQYTNIFAQMKGNVSASQGGSRSDTQYLNKYMSFHHLSLQLRKNLNIGLWEAISFGRDPDKNKNDFNPGYLNPIIFLRAVEQNEGSPDNAMLGLDLNWKIKNRLLLYGQLVLDEFKLDEITSRNGWWANKWGVQMGVQYINAFGVPNLDLKGEINLVRPYTYAHFTGATSHAHYNLPLAHPRGSNFREFIGTLNYQVTPKLWITGTAILSTYGTDPDSKSNFGSDILKSTNTHTHDFGNHIGQGIENNLKYIRVNIAYQLRHNLWIDVKQVFRDNDTTYEYQNKSTTLTMFSLRLNAISKRKAY